LKIKPSILSAALFAPLVAHAIDFEMKGYGIHTPAGVTYHYSLLNNTASNLPDPWHVLSVEIGRKDIFTDDYAKPELTPLPPIYPIPGRPNAAVYAAGDGVLSVTAPAGWNGYQGGEREHVNHTVAWELNKDAQGHYIPAAALLPGQTLTGLSVTRSAISDTYLNSNFNVHAFGIKKTFTGRVEKQDTSPPVLSVTLSPTTLRANEKPIPITATLTVKDDYDPAPEIKLESITANEPLEKEDIKDAQIGTDDRQFKLKAEREGKNKAGRIYTVTYSATDGSGNKATATATVVVPHDERKKDD
jgi:hypothetical protein